MKKVYCIFFLFLNSPLVSFAQLKYDYNWVFGGGAGDLDNISANFVINFDDGEVKFIPNESTVANWGVSISQSNYEGELLFHSNGCFITDKYFEEMENGDNLSIGYLNSLGYCETEEYNAGNPLIGTSFSLPGDNQDSIFYLIHHSLGFHSTDSLSYSFVNKTMYSKIDMTENDGLGEVTEKNQIVLEDTLMKTQMSAVKHADNESWWILVPHRNKGLFFTLLLQDGTISGPFEQEIGFDYPEIGGRGDGQGVFSPDGTKFVMFEKSSQAQYFDFNRETGQLSNPELINAIPNDSTYVSGVAFSPDSRFLYVCSFFHLYQIDTEAEDMQASLELIARFDEDYEELFPAYFLSMQLGPDCRVYITSPNSTFFLHVIDQPNEKGQACNFIQRGLHLPYLQAISIPIFPHYRLGTEHPICDPGIVAPLVYPSSTVNFINDPHYRFSPNPTREHLTLENFQTFEQGTSWELHDLNGRLLQTEKLTAGAQSQNIQLVNLAPGVYLQTVRSEETLIWRSKVVIF